MHHFFVDLSDIAGDIVHITGENFRHLKKVLRAEPGEHVLISDGEGTDYECEIEEIGERELLLRVCFREKIHELPAELYLFQGLPKSDKLELIVQKAVELGAFKIIPLKTKNTVVKLDEKRAKSKRERWQGIAEAAAKQSKRSIIPEVLSPMSWKEAMDYTEGFSLKCIPYENAGGMSGTMEILKGAWSLDFSPEKQGNNMGEDCKRARIAVFIGPEGGFSEDEISDAIAHGIQPISLGRRILRTETAAITAMSLMMMALELNSDK